MPTIEHAGGWQPFARPRRSLAGGSWCPARLPRAAGLRRVGELIVAVRSKAAADAYRERAPDLLAEPLSDDVYTVYTFYSPTMAKAATERDLKEIGLDEKQARVRALAKTQKQLGKPEDHVKDLKEGELGFFAQGHLHLELPLPAQSLGKGRQEVRRPAPRQRPLQRYAILRGRPPADGPPRHHGPGRPHLSRERAQCVAALVFKWTPNGWVVQ